MNLKLNKKNFKSQKTIFQSALENSFFVHIKESQTEAKNSLYKPPTPKIWLSTLHPVCYKFFLSLVVRIWQ